VELDQGAAVEEPALAPEPRDDLRSFRELVVFHQYDSIYAVHCYELAPRWISKSLEQTLPRAPAASRDLFRLLYFGEKLRRRRVQELLGDRLLAALEGLGILRREAEDSKWIRARFRLEVIGDTLLWADPSLDPDGVYYSEDSQFLRSMIRPQAGDVCLDLCTGTGVQALRLAPLAARVDAVDLNPAAVRLARINAAFNGWSDRMRVYEGDLWNALPGDATYDHIVCNPPLMPVPDLLEYPLCGHGGPDGLTIVRRILRQLGDRLSARGRLTLIGACTGDETRPAIASEAERWVGPDADAVLFLSLKIPLRDWAREISKTVCCVYGDPSPTRSILRFRTAFGEAFDETYVYTYLLKVSNQARESTPGRAGFDGLRIFDYSEVGSQSYWYVNRGIIAQ
jgi:SAM-dependent methyltransferase